MRKFCISNIADAKLVVIRQLREKIEFGFDIQCFQYYLELSCKKVKLSLRCLAPGKSAT